MKINVLVIVLLLFGCSKDMEPEIIELLVNESFLFTVEDSKKHSYIWDFGDGTIKSGASVEHAYSIAGSFHVTVREIKNERIVDVSTLYLVSVSKSYRPIINGISVVNRDDYPLGASFYDEYLFFNRNSYIKIATGDKDCFDCNYEITELTSNKKLLSCGAYKEIFCLPKNLLNLQDTSTIKLRVTASDDILTEVYDTSLYVGDDKTTFNFSLSNLYSGEMGSIADRFIFVYDNEFRFNPDVLKARSLIQDYASYISIGQLVGASSDGYYLSYGGTFSVNNSMHHRAYLVERIDENNVSQNSFSVEVPSYSSHKYYSTLSNLEKLDEFYCIIVYLGTNGMIFGETEVSFVPGSHIPAQNVEMFYFPF